ncbi:hypothetical protein [Abiotrophia sp. HMSC24B09]|uniref:hypothetical protein n=1 Tax=Abiotrophia sp. HMSC24B09 TaxID=1581061 RepID=UPI0008A4A70E|nr:hypothetical protein [Abiotrophia sp. HMSC24B09]OFS30477.1 hypothetical protein HMPREF3093_00600 [Abiotrophia sp. HMSC24B09]
MKRFIPILSLASLLLAGQFALTEVAQATESSAASSTSQESAKESSKNSFFKKSNESQAKSVQVGLPNAGYFNLPGNFQEQKADTTDKTIHYIDKENKEELYIDIQDVKEGDLPEKFKKLKPLDYMAHNDMSVYAFKAHGKKVTTVPVNLGKPFGYVYQIDVTKSDDRRAVIIDFAHPDDANRIVRLTFFSSNEESLKNLVKHLEKWQAKPAN